MLKLLRLLSRAVQTGAKHGSASRDPPVYDSPEQGGEGTRFLFEACRVFRGRTPLGQAASPLLADEQWAALRKLVADALSKPRRPAQIALELLTALDTTVRENLWHPFLAARGRQVLGPGDIFPIAYHNLKSFFEPEDTRPISLTPPPCNTNLGLMKLTYLGVLPTLGGPYEVELNFEAGVALSEFCQRPVLGVLLPNADMRREFQVSLSLEEGTFFGVRPLDEPGQAARIQALLDQADACGVKLALLPELAVTQELSQQLGQRVTSSESGLPMLVAGSFHFTEEDPKRRVNRSQAFVVGLTEPLEHDKFNPYVMTEWNGRALERPLREQLTERPCRLTVHWTEDGWSFTTLICKDFLDHGTLSLLDHLRVNFVFVVALSSETETFLDDANRLRQTGQTTTFVANFSGHPQGTCQAALAVFPIKKTSEQTSACDYSSCDVQVPCLLVLDLHKRQVGWLRISPAEG